MAERPPPMLIQWLGKRVYWLSCAWALTAHACESWVLFSANCDAQLAYLHLSSHHPVWIMAVTLLHCDLFRALLSKHLMSMCTSSACRCRLSSGFCSTEGSIMAAVGHRGFTQHHDGNRITANPSLPESPSRLCWALGQEWNSLEVIIPQVCSAQLPFSAVRQDFSNFQPAAIPQQVSFRHVFETSVLFVAIWRWGEALLI